MSKFTGLGLATELANEAQRLANITAAMLANGVKRTAKKTAELEARLARQLEEARKFGIHAVAYSLPEESPERTLAFATSKTFDGSPEEFRAFLAAVLADGAADVPAESPADEAAAPRTLVPSEQHRADRVAGGYGIYTNPQPRTDVTPAAELLAEYQAAAVAADDALQAARAANPDRTDDEDYELRRQCVADADNARALATERHADTQAADVEMVRVASGRKLLIVLEEGATVVIAKGKRVPHGVTGTVAGTEATDYGVRVTVRTEDGTEYVTNAANLTLAA